MDEDAPDQMTARPGWRIEAAGGSGRSAAAFFCLTFVNSSSRVFTPRSVVDSTSENIFLTL